MMEHVVHGGQSQMLNHEESFLAVNTGEQSSPCMYDDYKFWSHMRD